MEDTNNPSGTGKKTTMWVALLILIVAVLVGAAFWTMRKERTSGDASGTATSDRVASPIEVTNLKPNDEINSPLRVTGRARGWYFEASFPVRVLDANGTELGSGPVTAQGDWMTTDWVPFEGVISYSNPTTATGFVVFQKDNPSGLRENDEEYRVPVRFGVANTEFNFDLDVK